MKFVDARKDYQRLFHFAGVTHLMNDIWIAAYKRFDGLATSIDDDCYMWMPKASFDAQLQEGAHFFADQFAFDAYYAAYEQFLHDLKQTYESRVRDVEILTLDDVRSYLELAGQILSFFYRTEFFYVDEAYRLSQVGSVIKENLMRNYRLKERARVETLNDVWLVDGGQLRTLLGKLAVQFNADLDALWQYGIQEIYELFDGVRPDPAGLAARKAARLVWAENGVVQTRFGVEVIDDIHELLVLTGEVIPADTVLKGISASKGIVRGRVKIIVSDPTTGHRLSAEFAAMRKGDILVAETTSPEFMPACRKASAILANQGGLLSHAAVVSREFGIPCIVGLKFATQVLHDGDMVEVDADAGMVRILERHS